MKSVQIQLTTKCNQRCYMCRKYTWDKKEISVEVLKEKIEKYKKCTFTFSGGDTLHYTYLKELNELLLENNIIYQVFTNANYILNDEQKKLLINAECVQVSLDGSCNAVYNSVRRPVENGFDVAIKNIKWMYDNCKDIKLNCTVSKRNYFDMVPIANMVARIGEIKLRFFPVHTDKNAMLEPFMYEYIRQELNELGANKYYLKNYTNAIDFGMATPEPYTGKCFVKNEHRVIDEDGFEYTCCRAINDNGEDWDKEFAIENNSFDLENEKELYKYCSGCDRYRKFNEHWDEYKDKEKCFL